MGRTGRRRLGTRRALKWASVAVGVLATGTIGLMLWGQHRASVRSIEAKERLAALEAIVERESRVAANRPVLWGDSIDGSAFDHYHEALRLAREQESDFDELIGLRIDRGLDPLRAEQLRRIWRPAVEAMRTGARCSDASRQVVLDVAQDSVISLIHAREVVNMAIDQVREELRIGNDLEAVRISLDAATFGLDLTRSAALVEQMIGLGLLAVTEDCWTEARLSQLDAKALDVLANGLERLDHMVPQQLRLEFEMVLIAAQLSQQEDSDELSVWASIPELWSFGFSSRWMLADAVCELTTLVDRIRLSQDLSRLEREIELKRCAEQAIASSNPIVRTSLVRVAASLNGNSTGVIAKLRVLRMSVDVHRGLETIVCGHPLDDPRSDSPIQVERSQGSLDIRSTERFARRTVVLPSPR